MPVKPLSPCSVSGCPARAVRGGRCEAHQRPAWQGVRDERPTAPERGYGSAWQRLRWQLLQEQPECVVCGERAAVVHHLNGNPRHNERGNLACLCRDCHERTHGRKR